MSTPFITHTVNLQFTNSCQRAGVINPRESLSIFNLLLHVEFTYILSNNLAGSSEQASLNEELLRHW